MTVRQILYFFYQVRYHQLLLKNLALTHKTVINLIHVLSHVDFIYLRRFSKSFISNILSVSGGRHALQRLSPVTPCRVTRTECNEQQHVPSVHVRYSCVILLQTPGSVPFGTCICSNIETILSWTCIVYGPFEFQTSLGTSIFLSCPLLVQLYMSMFKTFYQRKRTKSPLTRMLHICCCPFCEGLEVPEANGVETHRNRLYYLRNKQWQAVLNCLVSSTKKNSSPSGEAIFFLQRFYRKRLIRV